MRTSTETGSQAGSKDVHQVTAKLAEAKNINFQEHRQNMCEKLKTKERV